MAPPYVCQTVNCSRRGIPSRLRVCPGCAVNTNPLPRNPVADLMSPSCPTCGGDDFRTVTFCADCGEPPQKVDPNARGPFICYHCMRDCHQECIGAECKCSCEGPHPLSEPRSMSPQRRMEWLRAFASQRPEGDIAFLLAQLDEPPRKRIGICECGHAVTEHGQYESECLISGCQCKQSRREVMAHDG